MQEFNDQLDYYRTATVHLREKLTERDVEIDRLTSFIIEVCKSDCPQTYREIVIKEIIKHN
jgi:hypothetical protein